MWGSILSCNPGPFLFITGMFLSSLTYILYKRLMILYNIYKHMFLLYRVRVWDVLFLVPNTLFFLFIIHRYNHVRHRIQSGIGSGGSPIFVAYFILIGSAATLAFIRCIVSIILDVVFKEDHSHISEGDANKVT